MNEEKTIKHPSFGMIGISNQSCNKSIPLFGSSIKHDRFISLRIKKACVTRNLHQEWFNGNDTIIEVILSKSQFTELITSFNIGDGVPCTIRYAECELKEEPPYIGQNEVFAEEVQEEFSKVMKDSDEIVKYAEDILTKKGNIKAQDKEELLRKIRRLQMNVKSNIPFLHRQFTRAMNKTVSIAKQEIEGFYTNTIMKLGKKALDKLNAPSVPEIEDKRYE